MVDRFQHIVEKERIAKEYEAIGVSAKIGEALGAEPMVELGEHREKLHRFDLNIGTLELDWINKIVRHMGEGFSLSMQTIQKVSTLNGSAQFYSARQTEQDIPDTLLIHSDGTIILHATSQNSQVVFIENPVVTNDEDWQDMVLNTESSLSKLKRGPLGQIRFVSYIKNQDNPDATEEPDLEDEEVA